MYCIVQPGISHVQVLSLQKPVKYCICCKKNCYTIDEYRVKYLELASKTRKERRPSKYRQGNSTPKNNTNQTIGQYYIKKTWLYLLRLSK